MYLKVCTYVMWPLAIFSSSGACNNANSVVRIKTSRPWISPGVDTATEDNYVGGLVALFIAQSTAHPFTALVIYRTLTVAQGSSTVDKQSTKETLFESQQGRSLYQQLPQ